MTESYRRMRPMLGTFVEVSIHHSEENRESVTNAAFGAIELIDKLLSFHNPESDLSRLNFSNGKWVTLHPLSIKVLKLAKAMTIASQGLFNCTIGGRLIRLGVLPNHVGQADLDAGTHDDILISGQRAQLIRPIKVTLDGIAKGFAVDQAVLTMKRLGCLGGWVNAGGDLRVFGSGIIPVHRREMSGNLSYIGEMQNVALATSQVKHSGEERFPGLIVSPTRQFVNVGVWSVIANTAWRADALTKVAAIASDSERATVITRLGGKMVPESLKR